MFYLPRSFMLLYLIRGPPHQRGLYNIWGKIRHILQGEWEMEWLEAMKESINYMEDHLLEDITPDDIARQVSISSFYFQKGFKIITGMTVWKDGAMRHAEGLKKVRELGSSLPKNMSCPF